MSESNNNNNRNISFEQLIKIIQLQSEQIESQKCQINALIKCQQTLLDSMYQGRTTDIRDLNKSFSFPQVPNRDTHSKNFSPNDTHEQREFMDFISLPSLITTTRDSVTKSSLIPSDYHGVDIRQCLQYDNNVKDSAEVKKEVASQLQDESINLIGLHSNEMELNEDEEEMNLSSLQEFVSRFKVRRIELGFTQRDVGVCLGLMQGNDFSQTTLSRFEALNLSYRNMRKLQPLLQRWLDAIVREGRDVIMARVSAFYQQQKCITEDESENVDTSFISAANKRRFGFDIQDVTELVRDEHSRANADSTTMSTKLSHSPSLMGNTVPMSQGTLLFRPDMSSPGMLAALHPMMPSSCLPSVMGPTSACTQQSDQMAANGACGKKRRKRARMPEEVLLRWEGIVGNPKVSPLGN